MVRDHNNIPTMMKITEVAEMYALPVHFVRTLVNEGEVVAIRAGNKILVNCDKFGEYLNCNRINQHKDEIETTSSASKTTEPPRENRSRIRPINRCK